jgi:hypothetical protein
MSGNTPLADLPVLHDPIGSVYADEKKVNDSVENVTKKADSVYGKDTSLEDLSSTDSVLLVKGEPVIRTGADVSNYLLDVRDDGDPALTFRSLVLGTVFAGLGAAMCQVRMILSHADCVDSAEGIKQIYLFKPIQVSVSTVFLLLLVYSVGTAWATFIPRASVVEGTRFAWLAPALNVINPGPFRLKEVGYVLYLSN